MCVCCVYVGGMVTPMRLSSPSVSPIQEPPAANTRNRQKVLSSILTHRINFWTIFCAQLPAKTLKNNVVCLTLNTVLGVFIFYNFVFVFVFAA